MTTEQVLISKIAVSYTSTDAISVGHYTLVIFKILFKVVQDHMKCK